MKNNRKLFQNCNHKVTHSFSNDKIKHILCLDCDGHYYSKKNPLCVGKWISPKEWDDWVNSGEKFDGKGFDYWKNNRCEYEI